MRSGWKNVCPPCIKHWVWFHVLHKPGVVVHRGDKDQGMESSVRTATWWLWWQPGLHKTCLKKKERKGKEDKEISIRHQSECFSNSNNLKNIHLINSNFQLCGGKPNKILFYTKKSYLIRLMIKWFLWKSKNWNLFLVEIVCGIREKPSRRG